MIEIKNLTVKAEGREILKDLSLKIDDGQKVVLFGPNGCGKSTLFRVIMGMNGYEIVKGDILLDGESIVEKSIDERVKMGLGYVSQKPVSIKGVTLDSLMNQYDFEYENAKNNIEELKIEEFLERDINYNLSGGETKRSELFTLSLLENIHTYLLDELDSGVDLDNISRIAKYIKKISKEKSLIITTHTGSILKEIQADIAYVMLDGKIVCSGEPKEIWKCIKRDGYENCLTCKQEKR